MSKYPAQYDDDGSIIRVDDNIQELGSEVINQIRDVIFAMQGTIGLNPQGSQETLADFLSVSFNSNGTLKSSTLTSVGLASLPIDDAQVGANAAIKESKLDLDYSTDYLHNLAQANASLLALVQASAATAGNDLALHIGGASALSDGSTSRHIDNQIDLQSGGSYITDVDGNPRGVTTVYGALNAINTDLVAHQNDSVDAHNASAISVSTVNFTEIPDTATDVQSALDAIDDTDRLQIGKHRAVMHDNGVPRTARSNDPNNDGYGTNVVPWTSCRAYLTDGTSAPNNSTTNGDNIITFSPTVTAPYDFDQAFTQVKIGDVVRINYGNGFAGQFLVESIRYTPGSDFTIRINGINLYDTDGYAATARIDRPLFDENMYGVYAVAAANNDIHNDIMGSVVVGHPRAASVLGLGFDPNQLDSSHFNLYLNLYPSGDPDEKTIQLWSIDVTGNSGATPGKYTLSSVVQATNNSFRAAGYNHRFIAFEYKGEFGIMLADVIGNASFSVINGIVSGGSLAAGSFTNNVIGDATDGLDALGFGLAKAGVAGPDISAYTAAVAAANLPTIIHSPRVERNAVVNGVRIDDFADTLLATDGYWPATIYSAGLVGGVWQVTYEVDLCLESAGLANGKTIIVQPAVDFSSPSYSDIDYGRFIIRNVEFIAACTSSASTRITVVSGGHNTGSISTAGSSAGLAVNIYFDSSSCGFNLLNVADISSGNQYNRLHEIYVDESGNTFSHERARMIKQGETTTLLNTNNVPNGSPWTITNVSPKLRGWRDDDSPTSTDFTKKVRFVVTDYNSSTGEYDGYIGRPSGSGVVDFGEVVRSRKEVPTRFYDGTNVDYIELLFSELDTSGTAIMPDSNSRYVDIDVYPSLAVDDEVFLLATCEADHLTIEKVVDRREFGTVSEKNFSTSAIEFIQTGDRHLHANSVIRGLSFRETGTADGEMIFDGGIALVNGAIVAVNDGSVVIPEIREATDATIDWAICVNEYGIFEPVIITSSKKEFFVSNVAPNYYVPSMTFAELVTTRKDLLPIAVVTATIASITLGAVTDVRRFATSGPTNVFSAYITDEDYKPVSATFYSLDSLEYWIDRYGISSVEIKEIDTAANISLSLSNKTVFYGGSITTLGTATFTNSNFENCSFNVGTNLTTNACIIENCSITVGGTSFATDSVINRCDIFMDDRFTLSSSEIKDCKVFVNGIEGVLLSTSSTPSSISNSNIAWSVPSQSYTLNDRVNVGTGYCVSGGNNTSVINCRFSSSASTQRPPFIYYATTTGTISGVLIKGNKFNDDSTASDNSAICFTSSASSASSAPTLSGTHIDDNYCEDVQNIIVAGSGTYLSGWRCYGVSINNNKCGMIGYLTSSVQSPSTLGESYPGLEISGNVCNGISTARTNYLGGHDLITPNNYVGTGNVTIKNNVVTGSITVGIGADSASPQSSSVVIDGNTVNFYSTTVHDNWFNSPVTAYGIHIRCTTTTSSSVANRTHATITNNRVGFYSAGSIVTWIGIQASGNCIVSNNRIDLFTGTTTLWSLVANPPSGSGGDVYVTTTGNQLFRNGQNIQNYILYNADVHGIITDNFIDDYDVGSTGDYTDAIVTTEAYITVKRNKNHQVDKYISKIGSGQLTSYTSGSTIGFPFESPGFTASDISTITNIYFQCSNGSSSADTVINFTSGRNRFRYRMNLSQIPEDVTIVGVSMDYAFGGIQTNYIGTDSLSLVIRKARDFTYSAADSVDPNTDPLTGTLSVTGLAIDTSNDPLIIDIDYDVNCNASVYCWWYSLAVTYRW